MIRLRWDRARIAEFMAVTGKPMLRHEERGECECDECGRWSDLESQNVQQAAIIAELNAELNNEKLVKQVIRGIKEQNGLLKVCWWPCVVCCRDMRRTVMV